MSASRQKKDRKESGNQNVINFPSEPKKSGGKTALKWIIGILCAVIAVVLIASSFILTPSFYAKRAVALTVGEHDLTAVDMNYYYRDAYYSMSQMLGNDTSLLDSMTDSIMNTAVEQARTTYAVYDEAVKNGFTLSQTDQDALKNEITSLDANAKLYGVANGEALISAMYGSGCGKASYRNYREIAMIAQRYQEDLADKQEFTQQDLDQCYTEHADEFDTVTYRIFTLTPEDGDMEAAEKNAQSIAEAAKKDPANMDVEARNYCTEEEAETYEADDATLRSDVSFVSVESEVKDWLRSSARSEKDVTVVKTADENGYIICQFLSADDNSETTVNIRHLLVSVDSDADEAALAEAEKKANGYLEEFRSGEKTEEAFGELAKKYSDDNAAEGGLMENVAPGQTVQEFNDWCFDAARKPGDCEIVKTTYGYHLIYFCSQGESQRNLLARQTLQNDFLNIWKDGGTAKDGTEYPGVVKLYTSAEHEDGMKYVSTQTAT